MCLRGRCFNFWEIIQVGSEWNSISYYSILVLFISAGRERDSITASHFLLWESMSLPVLQIPLLLWESMTITSVCYCWSLPGCDTTLTVGVYDHYHRLLLLVTARIRYHSYSGSLWALACTDCYCWSLPGYIQFYSYSGSQWLLSKTVYAHYHRLLLDNICIRICRWWIGLI